MSSMEKNEIYIPQKTLVEMLTLQYINGKNADSARDYVILYRESKEKIEKALKETEVPMNLKGLIT